LQLEGPDLTDQDFQTVARLGAPFKIVDNDLRPFRVEVAKRIAALNTAIGWPADASIAAADRARVRTEVAREFFAAEHGREPVDARELAGQIAKTRDRGTQTVAVRPDLLAGEVGVACGRWPTGGLAGSNGPTRPRHGCVDVHREARPCSPEPGTRHRQVNVQAWCRRVHAPTAARRPTCARR
jgi:hypothetical protein